MDGVRGFSLLFLSRGSSEINLVFESSDRGRVRSVCGEADIESIAYDAAASTETPQAAEQVTPGEVENKGLY